MIFNYITDSLYYIYKEISGLIEKYELKYKKFCTVLRLSLSDDFINDSSFQLNDNNKCAIIKYNRLGKTYKLYVPYSIQISSKMNRFKAYLKMENEDEIEITQQPGIMYMLSAEDLGGKEIIFKYLDGKTIKFIGKEIPIIS